MCYLTATQQQPGSSAIEAQIQGEIFINNQIMDVHFVI